MKHVVTVACVLVMMFQGGYSDAAWCICGILAAGYLCFKWNRKIPARVMLLMLAAVLVFAGSMLYNGISYEALAAIMKLLTACMLILSFFVIDADAHETAFTAGIAAAAVGYFTFCGVFHWDGAVASGRLQSVFQYADAAGIFLGIAAFLTRNDEKSAPYAIFLETAMLLTQSVGAILVYIVCWAIYLLKAGKKSDFPTLFIGFALSLLSAAAIYAIVYMTGVPQLAMVLPVAMIAFRKSIHKAAKAVITFSGYRFIIWAGCFAGAAAVISLFAVRGLRPVATYLERLIQIADGLKAALSGPLGIGPGAWQFSYRAYQSAPYNATIIHSAYAAAIAGAGLAIIVPIALSLVYWLKRQKWDAKSVCVMMILLHAVMDITLSFASIVFILAMLLSETIKEGRPEKIRQARQKNQASLTGQGAGRVSGRIIGRTTGRKPEMSSQNIWENMSRRSGPEAGQAKEPQPEPESKQLYKVLRVLFALPLMLCAIVLVTTVTGNTAAWAIDTGDYESAAELLDQRIIKNDAEALLTEMALYLQTEDYDNLEAAFGSMKDPNAEACYIYSQALMRQYLFDEAAANAYLCAEKSPFSGTGYELLGETLRFLDEGTRMMYIGKAEALRSGLKENALYTFILRIGDN